MTTSDSFVVGLFTSGTNASDPALEFYGEITGAVSNTEQPLLMILRASISVR